jgi:DNA repair protein RadC
MSEEPEAEDIAAQPQVPVLAPDADLLALVQSLKTPIEVLSQVLDHPALSPEVVVALLRHPCSPGWAVAEFAERADGALLLVLLGSLDALSRWPETLEALLTNPAVPPVKQPTIQRTLEMAKRREADAGRKKSLLLQVKDMPVGERLALAKKGNKDIRMILIKDSNEMIQLETIASSRITEGEILAIATMRDISDKVLRFIANNRRYRQNRQIVWALLNNPKTPVGSALSLNVSGLTDRELTELSKSRNVAGAVSRAAKAISDRRKGTAGGGGH